MAGTFKKPRLVQRTAAQPRGGYVGYGNLHDTRSYTATFGFRSFYYASDYELVAVAL